MNNTKNKPEIRFKGFNDEWEQHKLGDIVERVTRKNENLESTLPLTISAQYGLIDQNEFFDKRVASKDVSGYYLVKNGEFAYNKSTSSDAPWGAIKRLDRYESGVLSTLYIVFRILNSEQVDSDYLVTYYETDLWHKGIRDIAAEGARNHGLLNIAPDDFFQTALMMPKDIAEQRLIGSYFKELDNLITLHQREYSNLQILKKSMLENCFPKDGEKVPKIRFAGFTGDWEQRKLCKLADVKDSARIPNSKWATEGVPYIRASDLTNNDLTGTLFLSKEIFDYYKSQTGAPEQRDVLFNGGGDIGKALFKYDNSPIYVQGGAVLYVKTSKSQALNGEYLTAFFQSPFAKKYIEIAQAGGTMKHFTLGPAQDMPILYPDNKEQNQIGKFFSSLDNLIILHQRQLSQLQRIKKSMLHKMFA